jgi:hypothetical protein
MRLTVLFLCLWQRIRKAVRFGIPLVSEQLIIQSLKAGKLVDHTPFLMQAPEADDAEDMEEDDVPSENGPSRSQPLRNVPKKGKSHQRKDEQKKNEDKKSHCSDAQTERRRPENANRKAKDEQSMETKTSKIGSTVAGSNEVKDDKQTSSTDAETYRKRQRDTGAHGKNGQKRQNSAQQAASEARDSIDTHASSNRPNTHHEQHASHAHPHSSSSSTQVAHNRGAAERRDRPHQSQKEQKQAPAPHGQSHTIKQPPAKHAHHRDAGACKATCSQKNSRLLNHLGSCGGCVRVSGLVHFLRKAELLAWKRKLHFL